MNNSYPKYPFAICCDVRRYDLACRFDFSNWRDCEFRATAVIICYSVNSYAVCKYHVTIALQATMLFGCCCCCRHLSARRDIKSRVAEIRTNVSSNYRNTKLRVLLQEITQAASYRVCVESLRCGYDEARGAQPRWWLTVRTCWRMLPAVSCVDGTAHLYVVCGAYINDWLALVDQTNDE